MFLFERSKAEAEFVTGVTTALNRVAGAQELLSKGLGRACPPDIVPAVYPEEDRLRTAWTELARRLRGLATHYEHAGQAIRDQCVNDRLSRLEAEEARMAATADRVRRLFVAFSKFKKPIVKAQQAFFYFLVSFEYDGWMVCA